MANSTASILIKPTAAINRGDIFVFGSCTANGTRSFQIYLTMTLEPEIGLVTLPEAFTGQLIEKFDEFLLYTHDRGGVPDLSVSGDKSDLVVVDPHDPTMMSKLEAPMQLLNQLTMVTNLSGAKSA
jgi:hypothetical protein